MEFDNNVEYLRMAFWQIIMAAGPVLGAALAVGLVIGVIQAATSINEQTLSFVPKLVIVLGVFALLSGGSCQGMVFRTPAQKVAQTIEQLWFREMPNNVYTTRWLQCPTPQGPVNALAFTLPRSSPSYTGTLSPAQYQDIFRNATGRYGTTLDYAQETLNSLKQHGIHDKALEALLQFAKDRP